MTQYILKKITDLNSENSVFCLQGFKGEAEPDKVSIIDFVFTDERWLTGAFVIIKDGHWIDSADVHIMYKNENNEEVLLYTFAKDIVISDDSQFQLQIEVPYVSLTQAGVLFRVEYTNNHPTETVKVGLNLITHRPKDTI